MTAPAIFWTAVIVSTVAAAIVPATAQWPTSPPSYSPTFSPPKNTPPVVDTPKKQAAPSGPSIAGTWSGHTITVARQGDNLALSWFGSVQGVKENVLVAAVGLDESERITVPKGNFALKSISHLFPLL